MKRGRFLSRNVANRSAIYFDPDRIRIELVVRFTNDFGNCEMLTTPSIRGHAYCLAVIGLACETNGITA
jgi:hypothetical protein